jgi:20S proteasome alpha/beta subunit
MTLIIGIKCKDGVVLGADGAATYGVMGQPTIRQPTRKKLHLLGTQGVVGVSGFVGLSQRIAYELEFIRNKGIVTDPATPANRKPLGKCEPAEVLGPIRLALWPMISQELEIARMMMQTVGNGAPITSALTYSVACLLVGGKPCLMQFDQQASPELASDQLPFIAIGSGQTLADPFLAFIRRLYWPDTLPTVEEGVFATVWALYHVIETIPGGVALPMQVVTVQQENSTWLAKEMPQANWQETLQAIQQIEKRISSLPKELQSAEPVSPPPAVPAPTK